MRKGHWICAAISLAMVIEFMAGYHAGRRLADRWWERNTIIEGTGTNCLSFPPNLKMPFADLPPCPVGHLCEVPTCSLDGKRYGARADGQCYVADAPK